MRQRLEPPGLGTIWPAFTDALGGLLTILIFLITIFVISEVLLSREMENQDTAIDQLGNITSHLDQLLDEADARANHLQGRIDQLDAALSHRQRLLALAESRRVDSERLSKGLERELEHSRSELESQWRLVSELRAEKHQAEAKSGSLEVQAEELARELARMNAALAGTREERGRADQRIAELSATLEQNDRLIFDQRHRIEEMDRLIKERLLDRVEELESYTSDFYGRLRQVFADNPDIKVVGDRFVFQSEVLFPSGEADLAAAGKPDLDKFVQVYRQLADKLPADLPVIIEVQGHTDRVPIRTSRYTSNWELSTARALDVVSYLVSQGVPPQRLAATGMGEYHPIDPGDSPHAYRRNRRIELKITSR